MPKAIIVPYYVDQNAPSIPYRKIIELPQRPCVEQHDTLETLYNEIFDLQSDDYGGLTISRDTLYGDYRVEGVEGILLLVTFIDED